MKSPLGKGEVESSILSCSTINPQENKAETPPAAESVCASLRVNTSGTVAGNCPTECTTLYRYYDEAGALLYVGVSRQFAWRDYQHLMQSTWRIDAAFVRTEEYPVRHLAECAEDHAIKIEKPRHNVRSLAAHYPGASVHWYLYKMGGLKGENVQWSSAAGLFSLVPCDPPDWWDDARLFVLPYTGGPVKPKRRKANPEPIGPYIPIAWGPKWTTVSGEWRI